MRVTHTCTRTRTHTCIYEPNDHMRSLTWRLRCCCGCHCCGHCGCRLCDADAVHKFRCFHLVNKNYRILEVSTLATIAAILLTLSPMVALTIGISIANTVTVYIGIAIPVAVSVSVSIAVFIAATVIIVISAVSACIVSAVQRHRIGRIEIIVFHRCWL